MGGVHPGVMKILRFEGIDLLSTNCRKKSVCFFWMIYFPTFPTKQRKRVHHIPHDSCLFGQIIATLGEVTTNGCLERHYCFEQPAGAVYLY